MNTPSEDYHALLARHDAMRLRRRILTPEGSSGEAGRPAPPQTYDGTADQRLIEDFLPLVGPLEELIGDLYRALFDRHPYLRALFPESMAFQQAHLAAAFRYLIGDLHRTDAVAERFTQLGRDHRKLGVRPAHFAAFEGALVEALRARGGARWTGPLEDAWLRMLRLAVSSMVRGEYEAIAELSSWDATVTAHELRTPDLAVLRVRPQQPYPFRAGQYASLETPCWSRPGVRTTWRGPRTRTGSSNSMYGRAAPAGSATPWRTAPGRATPSGSAPPAACWRCPTTRCPATSC